MNLKLANLKKTIYYEKTAKKPNRDNIARLLSEQLKTRKTLDSFLIRLERKFSQYYQLKYNAKTSDIITVQKSVIDNDETIWNIFMVKIIYTVW